ncbi:DgyrCDS1435 [Dimorphilus gyrociliatus]|uniref:DgyrCDS1435 n=1 Tax=Dimorphilus gyrociliatus TaxID=2664684 RepID=A0A7I8VAH7_9ANNE|nr:DgyrCDS1435 [Dimorphilus gyrociliatus]
MFSGILVLCIILFSGKSLGKPALKDDWFKEDAAPQERRGFQWSDNFHLKDVQDPDEFKKISDNFNSLMPPSEFSQISENILKNADSLRGLLKNKDITPAQEQQLSDSVIKNIEKILDEGEKFEPDLAATSINLLLPKQITRMNKEQILQTVQNNDFDPDLETVINIGERLEEVLRDIPEKDLLPELVKSKNAIKGISLGDLNDFVNKMGKMDNDDLEKFEGAKMNPRQVDLFLEKWERDIEVPKTEEGLMENINNIPKTMIRQLDSDWISKISENNIEQFFDKVADAPELEEEVEPLDFDEDVDEPMFHVMAETIKRKGHKNIDKERIKKLAKLKLLNTDDVDKFEDNQICFDGSDRESYSFMDSSSQAAIFDKCEKSFGSPIDENGNLNDKYGSTITALEIDKLKELNIESSNAADNFEELMEFSSFLEPAKEQYLAERAEERLTSARGQSDLSSISTMKKYKCLFKRMNPQILLNVTNDGVSELCEEIAECLVDDMPKVVMEQITNVCLSTTMSLRRIGTLGVGMTESHVKSKMTDKQIKESVDVLQERALNCDTRREIILKYKGSNGYDKFTREDVSNIGTLILSLSDDEIDSLPNEALCGQFDKVVVEEAKKQLQTLTKREYNGFRFGYECLNDDNKFAKVFERMKLADDSTTCNGKETNATARRKRSTAVSLTCDDIRKMGHKATMLTQEQIAALSTKEFKDCIYVLGKITSWERSKHLIPLVEKAKETLDTDVSKWTDKNIEDLGSIVSGLQRSDADKLRITSLEAASSVGKHGRWHDNANSLQSAFESFLKNARNDDIGKLSAADIQSISELICGADTAKIQTIPSTIYKQVASSIGKTTTCVDGQLQKFAELAKKSFGSEIKKWNSATVKTVGVVIGGLTKTELSELSKDGIASLTPNNLKSLPYMQINGLTSQQLQWFTINQAASLSKSQYAALDKEKKDIISSKLSSVLSETGKAGSGGFINSLNESGATNAKIAFGSILLMISHILIQIWA